MLSLIRLVIAACVAVACIAIVACGGASPADARLDEFSDELDQPTPASATSGSTLADLADTGSTP